MNKKLNVILVMFFIVVVKGPVLKESSINNNHNIEVILYQPYSKVTQKKRVCGEP